MPPTAPGNPPPPPTSDARDNAGAGDAQRLAELLARPPGERLREYKYRFSQSVVFGLPVVALQFYGRALGPTDADRWVSLLQALLAGWIVYVNLGMLFEGILLLPLRRRVTGDAAVIFIALALYSISLVSALCGVATGQLLYRPLMFHISVMLLAAWSAWRWFRLARHA